MSYFGFETEEALYCFCLMILDHNHDLFWKIIVLVYYCICLLVTNLKFSACLINVLSFRSFFLFLLLFSASYLIFTAIFYSFRHYNVSFCDMYWWSQPYFESNVWFFVIIYGRTGICFRLNTKIPVCLPPKIVSTCCKIWSWITGFENSWRIENSGEVLYVVTKLLEYTKYFYIVQ